MKKILLVLLIILFNMQLLYAKEITDSGGPLSLEQASYNVNFYDLRLAVNPADSTIVGALTVNATIVQPLNIFIMDLDTLLKVSEIRERKEKNWQPLTFTHRNGIISVDLEFTRQFREEVELEISYGGKPRVARMPPWSGGFSWDTTASGQPWIGTSCQSEGADIWWPCKDHYSDEPDSMRLHITVPSDLYCATNGRLEHLEEHDKNKKTFHWFVSTPINNYGVSLNIAPYEIIEESYQSTSGDIIPVFFYVLPENLEKARIALPEFLGHVRFLEETVGPYPFRADKYGIAETPYLGMEHQTIIAYGAGYDNTAMTGKDFGFDALHFHELAHEWFANLVTCADVKDLWLHEGFANHLEALYLKKTYGDSMYIEHMKFTRGFWNLYPIAPQTSQTDREISRAPIYTKGSWTLHTLRYLIGDDSFFTLLRRMAYPDPKMEKVTDGSHTRLVDTRDFIHLAEQISGMELDWFFDIYVRQPELPVLQNELKDNYLFLKWQVPGDRSFPMPIDVVIGDETRRVDIPAEGTIINFPSGIEPQTDPLNRVLKRKPLPEILKLSTEQLEIYIGKYSYSKRWNISIREQEGKLILNNRRMGEVELLAESRDTFFVIPADDYRIVFDRDDDDTVKGATVYSGGREMYFAKEE